MVEACAPEHERHQGDVRRIHRLQREAIRRALEVRVRHQIFDGLQHLLQDRSLENSRLEHFIYVTFMCVFYVCDSFDNTEHAFNMWRDEMDWKKEEKNFNGIFKPKFCFFFFEISRVTF